MNVERTRPVHRQFLSFLPINVLSICIFVFGFGLVLPLHAHSGRTDSNGGHWNRKTGTYHYHSGGSSSSRSSSYNSGATRTNNLSSRSSLDKWKSEKLKAAKQKRKEENTAATFVKRVKTSLPEYRLMEITEDGMPKFVVTRNLYSTRMLTDSVDEVRSLLPSMLAEAGIDKQRVFIFLNGMPTDQRSWATSLSFDGPASLQYRDVDELEFQQEYAVKLKHEFRIWRDTTSHFECEAALISFNEKEVFLLKRNGRKIEVRKDRLSTADHEYLSAV